MNNLLYTVRSMPVNCCRGAFGVLSTQSFTLKSNIDASSSLNNCAAWPFENYKQKLKRKVKGRHNSVARNMPSLENIKDYM